MGHRPQIIPNRNAVVTILVRSSRATFATTALRLMICFTITRGRRWRHNVGEKLGKHWLDSAHPHEATRSNPCCRQIQALDAAFVGPRWKSSRRPSSRRSRQRPACFDFAEAQGAIHGRRSHFASGFAFLGSPSDFLIGHFGESIRAVLKYLSNLAMTSGCLSATFCFSEGSVFRS